MKTRNSSLLFFYCVLISTTTPIFSQQHPQGVYRYERQLIHNPAYAGHGKEARALLHYRNQWVGVEGAPEQAILAFDGSLQDHRVGWGAVVYNENTNMVSKTACYGVYRYRLNWREKHRLDMGFSLGVKQHRFDFQKVHALDQNDEVLLQHRETGSMPDAALGLVYSILNWELAFAVAHPFFNKSRYYSHQGEGELQYQLVPHYLLDTRYRHFLSSSWALEPILHLSTVQGMPLQAMGALYLNYDRRYWLGVCYTHASGLGSVVGMRWLENLSVAYLYDYGIAHVRGFHRGSHEVLLRINIPQPGSFRRSEQNNHAGQTALETESMSRNFAEQLRAQQEELVRLRQIMERDRDTVEVYIEKYSIAWDELASLDFSETGGSEEFFLVLGAYYRLQDAAFFQQILQRDLNLDTRVFQRGDGKYFFVYYRGYKRNEQTLEQIQDAINSLHKKGIQQYINGNLWIYRME